MLTKRHTSNEDRRRLSALALALGVLGASCADLSEAEYLEGSYLEGTGAVGETVQELGAQPVCALGTLTPLPRVDATASSVESPGLAPRFAIDEDPNTRWSSAFSDNQWLRVDLGAVRYIDAVTLSWETASSQRYDLEVSHDGVNWKIVKVVPYNPPGSQQVSYSGLNSRGRYLRVQSHVRNTEWGVSLYDVGVLGDANGACAQPGALRLDAVHSGRALDMTDWSTGDGAGAQQWGYGGGNNQKWILSHGGSGAYQLRNLHSGKCLEVEDGSSADRARLQQATCQGVLHQQFTLRSAGTGRYQLVAVHSGKSWTSRAAAPKMARASSSGPATAATTRSGRCAIRATSRPIRKTAAASATAAWAAPAGRACASRRW